MEKNTGKIGIVLPTFEEYSNRYSKADVVAFVPDNKDCAYNSSDLIKFYDNKPIKTLLLINPDNPSGNFIPKKEVLELAEWTKNKGIKFIVDESFVDFSDDFRNNSLLDNATLSTYNNLFVMKSISKSYGVPGLRLGILASSDTQTIDYIKKDVSIWNINSFAEFYMQIFNKYSSAYDAACECFIAETHSLCKTIGRNKLASSNSFASQLFPL